MILLVYKYGIDVNGFCRQFLGAISTFQDKFMNILFFDQNVYFSNNILSIMKAANIVSTQNVLDHSLTKQLKLHTLRGMCGGCAAIVYV